MSDGAPQDREKNLVYWCLMNILVTVAFAMAAFAYSLCVRKATEKQILQMSLTHDPIINQERDPQGQSPFDWWLYDRDVPLNEMEVQVIESLNSMFKEPCSRKEDLRPNDSLALVLVEAKKKHWAKLWVAKLENSIVIEVSRRKDVCNEHSVEFKAAHVLVELQHSLRDLVLISENTGNSNLSVLFLVFYIGLRRIIPLFNSAFSTVAVMVVICFQIWWCKALWEPNMIHSSTFLESQLETRGIPTVWLFVILGYMRGLTASAIQGKLLNCAEKGGMDTIESLWKAVYPAGKCYYYYMWYYVFLDRLFPKDELGEGMRIFLKILLDTSVNVPFVEIPCCLVWFGIPSTLLRNICCSTAREVGPQETSPWYSCCASFTFWFLTERWWISWLMSTFIWLPGSAILFSFPLSLQVYVSNVLGTLEMIAYLLISQTNANNGRKTTAGVRQIAFFAIGNEHTRVAPDDETVLAITLEAEREVPARIYEEAAGADAVPKLVSFSRTASAASTLSVCSNAPLLPSVNEEQTEA